MDKTYPSKQDAWLVLLIWGSLALPVVLGVLQLILPTGSREAGWVLLATGVVVVALVLLVTSPLYYRVTSSSILVRCGCIRYEVKLADIETITPTHDMLSSPAMSLDRLRIEYSEGSRNRALMISPRDKAGFLTDVVARAPGLELHDDRVRRAA